MALLSTMAPAISPTAVEEPSSVSVLDPAPVAVRSLVNLTSPVPMRLIWPPPVVPARLRTRSVMKPSPSIVRVAVLERLPRSIVPFAAVKGAPRLLVVEPLRTLLSELTRRLPLEMTVLPVKELAPEMVMAPTPDLVRPPSPERMPDSMPVVTEPLPMVESASEARERLEEPTKLAAFAPP